MIRVLQIGMTDNQGGIETFLINYYRNIDKNCIQFDFINIYNNELCFQNEINKYGGIVYNVCSYYKNPIKYVKELYGIIKDNNYNIIHCNMNSAVMLYPLIAAKLAKAKVIIAHAHNSSSDKGIIKTILHNINRNFIPILANQFWSCSEKAGKWFFKNKINSEKYKIISNAIDLNKYKYNVVLRKEKRKELKINDNNYVIGNVGRLNKQKNHKFLIDVFYLYQKEESNSRLLMIGKGPLKKKIVKRIQELKIKDKVILLEDRSDINELMMAMDCFVLPSLYEGLPLVGVEAQATGLPFLCSTNVTDEIVLTKNSSKLKLCSNKTKWLEEIHNMSTIKRECENNERLEEFDIKKCAIKLKNYYELLNGDFK